MTVLKVRLSVLKSVDGGVVFVIVVFGKRGNHISC